MLLCVSYVSLNGLKTKLCKKILIVTSSSCFQQVQHQDSASKSCPGSTKAMLSPGDKECNGSRDEKAAPLPRSQTHAVFPVFPKDTDNLTNGKQGTEAVKSTCFPHAALEILGGRKLHKGSSAASRRDFHLCSIISFFFFFHSASGNGKVSWYGLAPEMLEPHENN